jgi:tetratricopeptide (TPR) repeat protein
MGRSLVFFLFIGLTMLAPARACLWDSDTLDTEATGRLDLVTTVTGRFARNPPRYYEMRLARVQSELARGPAQLALYDDAGVACDHLGRGDEAIAWMERKAAAMRRFSANDDERYRYEANLGTLLAHRWLRAGRPKARLGELRAARDHIAAALKINPNAHFGREAVQLELLDWHLYRQIGKPLAHLGEDDYIHYQSLHSFETWRSSIRKKSDDSELTKGLCGIIQLGGAWNNVGIVEILRESLSRHDGALRCFLAQRIHELDPSRKILSNISQTNERNIAANFRRLRTEADTWQASRTAYMTARLDRGEHPDTHPHFWDDWNESPMPEIRISESERWDIRFHTANSPWQLLPILGVLLGLVLSICVGRALFRRWRNSKRSSRV